MINPTDEIFVDLQASCTKEVAVAKMLGWMQGFIRPRYIQVTESGISADQLPSLRSLEGSLQEHLAERHEAARQDLFKAAEGDAPAEALLKYSEAVLDCEDLIKVDPIVKTESCRV